MAQIVAPPQIVILLENISNLKRIPPFIPQRRARVKNKKEKPCDTRPAPYVRIDNRVSGSLRSILYRSLLPSRKHLLKLHSGRVSCLFSIKRVGNFLEILFYPATAPPSSPVTRCTPEGTRTYRIHSTSSLQLHPPSSKAYFALTFIINYRTSIAEDFPSV